MRATNDHLRRPRVGNGIVTLDDGSEIEIRPLSRRKALQVHETQERSGMAASESLLLHLGMVDPVFTQEEVLEWMDDDGAAGDIQVVSRAIGVISGMVPNSGKEAYKSAG